MIFYFFIDTATSEIYTYGHTHSLHDALPISEGYGGEDIGESVHAPPVIGCGGSGMSTEAPEILLAHYLKTLKLPTFQREYQKLARQCAAEGVDHIGYLTRLAEREMIERRSEEHTSELQSLMRISYAVFCLKKKKNKNKNNNHTERTQT